jgi:hypothetical protein
VAKAEAKFELTIGALDRFTQPFMRFGAAVDRSTAGVRRYGRELQIASRRISAGLGLPRLGQAFAGLGKGLKNVGSQAGVLASRLGMIGVAVGGAATGIYAAVRQYTDAGDEAVKAAQKAGITASAWQEMAYAADLSGLSNEKLQAGYIKLQKSMVDAAGGGKAGSAAFKALGIDLKNAEGKLKANDAIMMELADAFAKMPDGAKKTALAMQVFGKSGAELLPLLNSGADGLKDLRREAVNLGLVFGEEASRASEEFNDNVSRLGYRVKGLVYTLGKNFLPVADKVVATLSALIDENRELIKVKIAAFADKAIKALPQIKEGLVKVVGGAVDFAKKGLAVVDMLGGFGNVAKIAGAVLAGPLVKSVIGLLGPLKTLGVALLTTPFGLVLAAGAAVAFFLDKMGALGPLVEGLKAGFGAMSSVIGEAFQGALAAAAELMGNLGLNLTDVNGQVNPEGWREMGKAIGEITGGVLADLIKGLGEVLGLINKIGIGLGELAGKAVFGDVDKQEDRNRQTGALRERIQKARAAGDNDEVARLVGEARAVNAPRPGPVRRGLTPKTAAEAPAGWERRAHDALARPGAHAPNALAAPAGRPVVQETKHTEEKVEKVNLTLTTPPGFGVTPAGALPGNVQLSSSPGMIGQQNM